jgi:hypothetical protein
MELRKRAQPPTLIWGPTHFLMWPQINLNIWVKYPTKYFNVALHQAKKQIISSKASEANNLNLGNSTR